MPKLPDYTALGDRPTPRPSGAIARFTPTTGGEGAIGQAIQRGGAEIAQAGLIIEEANNKHDNLVAEDAFNRLQTEQEKLAYDPDGGFLNDRAGDAIGQDYQEAQMQRFTTAADGIESGLKTDNQKRLFKQRRSIAEKNHRSTILRHQSKETSVYSDATETAAIATEIRNISQNPMDDTMFNASMARIDATVASKGDRTGMPPEAIAEAKKAVVDDVWTSRIISLVDDNPQAAKAYYKQAKKHLSGESRDKIEGLLEAGTLDQESQQRTDAIVLSDKTPEAMMKDARKISDPKLRDETVRRVKARISEQNTFDKLAQSEAANAGYTMIANGQKVPTSVYAQMDGKTQLAMRKLEVNGQPSSDDMEVYQAIKQQTPQEFAQLDLMRYAPYLKESTLKSFIDEQNSVKKDDFSVIGDMTRINASIETLGLSKKEKGGLYAMVDGWTRSLDHKPTGDELQKFLDEMQTEVITDSDYGETTKKIGLIKVDGVPDADIPDIVQALSRRGVDASDENIKKMYDASLGGF